MFAVGKTVHDSLNSLSIQDEVRTVSELLVAFVARIDFGRDLERHLQVSSLSDPENSDTNFIHSFMLIAAKHFPILML